VEEEGLAADLVEDLGAAGLEARALARGHDCDSEVGGFHTMIMVSCARWNYRQVDEVPGTRTS
jgi:hypothetical protein